MKSLTAAFALSILAGEIIVMEVYDDIFVDQKGLNACVEGEKQIIDTAKKDCK